MPQNVEAIINAAIGGKLCEKNPHWELNKTLFTECSDVILGSAGSRIDILVHPKGGQPVAVETEFKEGPQVEREAVSRLGKTVKPGHEIIECAMAVAMPSELRDSIDYLDQAKFKFSTHQLSEKEDPIRWPTKDWVTGNVDRLADAIEYISLSERRLQIGANKLEATIRGVAEILLRQSDRSVLESIANCLHQKSSEQTVRMAVAILINATVFHCSIEDKEDIPKMFEIRDQGFSSSSIEDAWTQITDVNYLPIFSIAKEILRRIPVRLVHRVFDQLNKATEHLAKLGSGTFHDLSGRMFQRLIVDRKFLATFYTLPASAQLLAELAVDRLDIDWSSHTQICNLRIADFACGTGALLSAVQRDIYRRFRRAGGNDMEIHRQMIEDSLIGLDIMPSSTHITASMLSSPYPEITYGSSMIHPLSYGRSNDGTISIGSLDLLGGDYIPNIFDTGSRIVSLDGTVSDQEKNNLNLPDGLCDVVIMNPPFTRPTNHEIADVPVPSFAGFGTEKAEQHAMSEKLKGIVPKIERLRNGKFGNGNAGLASNFMDLAHAKLKNGGVLAMVLPFSFTTGAGWENARRMLHECYDKIRVISIATTGSHNRAFSADTGMAECLLIATKVKPSARSGHIGSTEFSNLQSRPKTFLEASEYINDIWADKDFEDSVLEAGGAGVLDLSVKTSAQKLQKGILYLPRISEEVSIPIVYLKKIAGRGLLGRDISAKYRGHFIVRAIRDGEEPTYPILWSHNCKLEQHLIVQPDSCGDIRLGYREDAINTWDRVSSRLHCNIDFRINSQSLSMCLTPEPCIGGGAWPNVITHDKSHEIPLLLWSNSTLGLIMFWFKGTRQQQGRARLSLSRHPDLPVLDIRALTEEQLEQCKVIFNKLKDRPFLPANEAYRDQNRKNLDTEFFTMLRLDSSYLEGLNLLRRKWCAEPSVHGGKSTRIYTKT